MIFLYDITIDGWHVQFFIITAALSMHFMEY